jgi:transporter family-2 protein
MTGSTTGLFLTVLLMVAAGAGLALQAPINAKLAGGIGSTTLAACISFGVGFLVLLVIVALRGDLHLMPGVAGVPLWVLVGGCFGAFFTFAATFAIPRVGAATLFSAVVFGQLFAAMVVDRIGFLGAAEIPLTFQRLAGVALVFAGVLLSALRF